MFLHAVSGYKIPFLRLPHQWRTRPTVVQKGQPAGSSAVFVELSTDASRFVGPFPIPVCSGQLSPFNEAESRKVWELDRPWLRACLRLAEQLRGGSGVVLLTLYFLMEPVY